MRTTQEAGGGIEGKIWTRLLRPADRRFPKAAAQEILGFHFTDAERARMHELAERNGEGELTPSEREELEGYIRVANVLALLHAIARRSLQKESH